MKTGITIDEAARITLDAAAPLASERIATQEALGRVLAEPIEAPRTLPPADCSAMDGYAVRSADLTAASDAAPVALPVVYEVPAGGHGPRALAAGEAARIFTGAPVPEGADAVVRQEDTDGGAERVAIRIAAPAGDNVRRAGEDVHAGDVVLAPGTRIGPGSLGMLASVGRTLVAVVRRPRVAILSGGDELVEPDRDPGASRILSSNAYALAAQVREAGGEPVNLGIAEDTPEALERLFASARFADVVVSSAGVSVGDHDHVRPVLEKLGCRLTFWGVKMKPGYPLAFGRFDGEPGALVFGLPGNPVSAMVTFEQFVRPVLRRMGGHRSLRRPAVDAVLDEALTKKAGRHHFVRVVLRRDGDRFHATATGNQSSGALHSMSLADGLLHFPADATRLEAGSTARVDVLEPEVFAADGPAR